MLQALPGVTILIFKDMHFPYLYHVNLRLFNVKNKMVARILYREHILFIIDVYSFPFMKDPLTATHSERLACELGDWKTCKC